jgi:hypothetical protein
LSWFEQLCNTPRPEDSSSLAFSQTREIDKHTRERVGQKSMAQRGAMGEKQKLGMIRSI